MHNRQSHRLPEYDYSRVGAYFVTVCAHNRKCLFGDIQVGSMIAKEYGLVVRNTWKWLSDHYGYAVMDAFVVMPNHIHGIIIMTERRGGSRTAPTKRKTIGRLIGAFKTVSTKQINAIRKSPGTIVWQRDYYDHIIRAESEFNKIREYVINNPITWESDEMFVAG